MATPKKKALRNRQTAKVFMSGASQAVRLPMEYRLDADEVALRKEGNALILTPLYESWEDYRAHAPKAGDDFLEAVLNRHDDEAPDSDRAAFD